MATQPPSRLDLVTSLVFAAGLLALLPLHLLPALLAGLLVYVTVNAMVPAPETPLVIGTDVPRILAVSLFATLVIALIILTGFGLASFFRHGGENLPALVQGMAEILDDARNQLPGWLLAYLPEDAEELRQAMVAGLRANADMFQVAGTGLGRALGHILLGMVVGALLSLERAVAGAAESPLALAIGARGLLLASAFRRVVFAQLRISALNTVFTAIYLALVLPLLGIDLPFSKTLIVLTFVAGLLPILGNLISNTVICIVSLSQGFLVAMGSLVYLILIHKLEYFLNVKIIGGHIRARAWELLSAMLVMEAAFGIAGLIAAPVYYAYLKAELAELGYL